jgi:vacuolar-type H+-ATPase subunit I/STV1
MKKKSIAQRLKIVNGLARELSSLKTLSKASKKFIEDMDEREPKPDRKLIENIDKRIIKLESQLNKLLPDE